MFQFFCIVVNSCYCLFLITAIAGGMKWYLTVILICISIMINDAEYPVICFLAIWYICLETTADYGR